MRIGAGDEGGRIRQAFSPPGNRAHTCAVGPQKGALGDPFDIDKPVEVFARASARDQFDNDALRQKLRETLAS